MEVCNEVPHTNALKAKVPEGLEKLEDLEDDLADKVHIGESTGTQMEDLKKENGKNCGKTFSKFNIFNNSCGKEAHKWGNLLIYKV